MAALDAHRLSSRHTAADELGRETEFTMIDGVLEAYERWLASPQAKLTDVQALRLTGLFDRPAIPDCLAVLRQAPAIPGITDALVPLDDDAWNAVFIRLHDAHLIRLCFPPVVEGNSASQSTEPCQVPVDVHPLMREYFAKQLRQVGKNTWWQFWRTKKVDGFKEAHTRLFDHLCETTPHQPDTIDGLQPLYQAVVHGCLAGMHVEACADVYIARILRGLGDDVYYSDSHLGAYAEGLRAVTAFFDVPWSRVSPNLTVFYQGWIFGEAASLLCKLGRFSEALEPRRAGLEMDGKEEFSKNAALTASYLSELEMTLGLFGDAVASARRAIAYADHNEEAEERILNRVIAGTALHQSGAAEELAEAHDLFEQAEILQREDQPELPLLYSLPGFQYCDLILTPAERAAWQAVLDRRASVLECGGKRSATPLLDRRGNTAVSGSSSGGREGELTAVGESLGAAKAVSAPLQGAATALQDAAALENAERRAVQTLEWIIGHKMHGLYIALDHLTLARVALYLALLEPQRLETFDPRYFTAALDGLRKAGHIDYLPLALLTAALQHHFLGDHAAAIRFLAEAQQIAERGPMPLYLADVHLHRARLVGSMADAAAREQAYPGVDPHAELGKARELIHSLGYGRRTEELADAEAAAAAW